MNSFPLFPVNTVLYVERNQCKPVYQRLIVSIFLVYFPLLQSFSWLFVAFPSFVIAEITTMISYVTNCLRGSLKKLKDKVHVNTTRINLGSEDIAQNAYCSREIYCQFSKVCRSVICVNAMKAPQRFVALNALGCLLICSRWQTKQIGQFAIVSLFIRKSHICAYFAATF